MSDIPKWLEECLIKTNERYSKGKSDFSTTELISPPMIVRLKKENDVEIDPISYLNSFTGTSVHNQIEKMLESDDKYIVEERYYCDIEVDGKTYKISGQIDLYEKESKKMYDHKNTSIFKVTQPDHEEYEQQLNINRYILHQNGIECESLHISAFPVDWRKSESKNKPDYPEIRYKTLDIPMWSLDKTLKFIKDRIRKHTAENVSICSEKERWKTKDVYAVKNPKRKTAVKLHYNEVDAYKHVLKLGGKPYYVEHREGEDKRCEEYCIVNMFCPYYKEKLEKFEINLIASASLQDDFF